MTVAVGTSVVDAEPLATIFVLATSVRRERGPCGDFPHTGFSEGAFDGLSFG